MPLTPLFNSFGKDLSDLTIKQRQLTNGVIMNRIEQIQSMVSDLEVDMNKFYDKGNKAAGTRARKQLQELKKVAQEIRLEIQDMKNSGEV
ncbi:MAG: hypothetical protein R3283_09820 [Balneolaceae bacterium]|nr:hypothetical protein [Balneolaceae bacterium]